MPVDLKKLDGVSRILFSIPLVPQQGHRFQPTGFPGLGAATFQTVEGRALLVESAQSMANRLELTVWDEARNDVREEFKGLSHVRVTRQGQFLTDTILESHRINSPYLLEGSDKTFFETLKAELGGLAEGPINRHLLAKTLLRFDVGSLLHGAFLAKKELAGGRLRIARALSAFIEADRVETAASGGVKKDDVNPSGDAKSGFGHVPFARDEYTAERIRLFVNFDLAQVRGYGLGPDVEKMLILLGLYKVRALVDGNLRLRTACDLRVAGDPISASLPAGFVLPDLADLTGELRKAIHACREEMEVATVTFNDALRKGKESADDSGGSDKGVS